MSSKTQGRETNFCRWKGKFLLVDMASIRDGREANFCR